MNLSTKLSLTLGAALLTATVGFTGCATGGKTASRTVANTGVLAAVAETIAARSGASAASVEAAATSYIQSTFLAAGQTFAALSASQQKSLVDRLVGDLKKGDAKLAKALGLTALSKAEFTALAAEAAKAGEAVGATGASGYASGATDADVDAAVNKISVAAIRRGYRTAANNIQVLANDPEIYPILKDIIIESAAFSEEAKQVLLGELKCVADKRLSGKTELGNGLAIIKKVRAAAKRSGMTVQEVAQAWDQASIEVIGRSTRAGLKTPCDFINEKLVAGN